MKQRQKKNRRAIVCPYCGSRQVNKSYTEVGRYQCTECGEEFQIYKRLID